MLITLGLRNQSSKVQGRSAPRRLGSEAAAVIPPPPSLPRSKNDIKCYDVTLPTGISSPAQGILLCIKLSSEPQVQEFHRVFF